MDYFFKSTGCPACIHFADLLKQCPEKWTGSLKIVEVESDETGKLMTYIDGKECGESPVGLVPAYYSAKSDQLVTGFAAVQKEIKDASWNN